MARSYSGGTCNTFGFKWRVIPKRLVCGNLHSPPLFVHPHCDLHVDSYHCLILDLVFTCGIPHRLRPSNECLLTLRTGVTLPLIANMLMIIDYSPYDKHRVARIMPSLAAHRQDFDGSSSYEDFRQTFLLHFLSGECLGSDREDAPISDQWRT